MTRLVCTTIIALSFAIIFLTTYVASMRIIECTDCPLTAASAHEIFIVAPQGTRTSAGGESLGPNHVARPVIYPIDDVYRTKFALVPIEDSDKLSLSDIDKNFVVVRGYPKSIVPGSTPDDHVNFGLYEYEKFMGDRIVIHKWIAGIYPNPNIVKICDELMMTFSLTWSVYPCREPNSKTEIMYVADRLIYFQKAQNGVMQCDTKNYTSKIGLQDCRHLLPNALSNSSFKDGGLSGQDPRILIINRTDAVIVYNEFQSKYFMQMAWLKYDCSGTNNLTIVNRWTYIEPGDSMGFKMNQKNWSPFMHNDRVHFVQRFDPLLVIAARGDTDFHFFQPNNKLNTDTISDCKQNLKHYWSGAISGTSTKDSEVRGGTPAYLVKGAYLTFFHSVTILSHQNSYVFGALIFSKDPPFRVLKITPFPIADYWSYQGPYSLFEHTRRIDYILFPMNFFMVNDVIHLSLGRQDKEGWMYTLSYNELIRRMVPVNQTCL